jgi:flagellar protein FliT
MKVWRTRGNVRKIAPRRIAGNCGRDNSDFPANRELGVLMHETSLAMMDYQHVLDTYAAVSVKSGEMLEAAKASDWNRLVELEQECRALVDALRRDDCTSRDAPRPDPGYIRRKYDLIRKVLADDARSGATPSRGWSNCRFFSAVHGRNSACSGPTTTAAGRPDAPNSVAVTRARPR